jgi:hypothetical protein
MTENYTIEDYIDSKKLNLDAKKREFLLEALKNDSFNFKYKDLGRPPMGIEGQDKITGLGIHSFSEQVRIYADSIHALIEDIILFHLDGIITSLAQTINDENNEEKIERNLEQKTTKINENVRNIAQEIQDVLLKNISIDDDRPVFKSVDEFEKTIQELKIDISSIVGN